MKSVVLVSALVIGAMTLAAGPSRAAVGVVVNIAPPAPMVEAVPVAPVAGYIWRPGHWRWNGVRYVWIRGRYVAPPYVGAVWVPGHWGPRGPGWVWIGGHWRR
ncbi:MAG TPA: hypothetical protein VL899_02160 [Alphaproteobacteria bacterium]|nr:hypothetical protein [Alphaproteobacteria bacterium]